MFSLKGVSRIVVILTIVILIIIAGTVAYYYTVILPSSSTTTPTVTELKIGVILPLSGSLAETGADLKRGVDFAVSQINNQGGIKSLGGAKLVVVYGDSASKPETGAAEAERLITEEKVVALMGGYASSITDAIARIAEKYNVVLLNPDSSLADLTERGYKWFFRTSPHDGMFVIQQVEFVNWLNNQYGGQIKNIGIIYEDTAFGTGTAQLWKKYFSEAGYNIVAYISYHAATVTSLTSEVQTLKGANTDLVLIAAYTSDAILFVKTCKDLDFNPKAILAQDAGFIDPSYVKQIGSLGFYIFSREVFNWDLLKGNLAKLNDEYKAKFGVDLDGNSARDYTGVWTLYYAIEDAAKKVNPSDLTAFRSALRDALKSINLMPSQIIMPWAGIKFDEKGQNTLARGIIVQMMPDGKYYTVYPRDVATKNVTFPMPTWKERGAA